jgi:beta-aspartyl-peptidase (threonine type)
MKLVLAKRAADRVREGRTPEHACNEAVTYLKARLNGHGGMILLDAQGRFGVAHNTPRMAWAYKNISRENSGITCN